MNTIDYPLPKATPAELPGRQPVSLQIVAPRRGARRVLTMLAVLIAIVILSLIFVPWQQSVTGKGQIIVFSAMERPQNVDAQIPGRLVQWHVQEGDVVKAGQTIAEIADLDSKFLDLEQPRRLEAQRRALVERREAARTRAVALENQLRFLDRSRNVAIPTAGERAGQAGQRFRAAEEAVTGSEQSYRASREVALPAAGERAQQAVE
ncbi:MAG TPA: biotin/lipoyl-binding protein, partial [Armatimonadota bacterium]|nr:biotin/lipoyl-binding protein [Armatimonadota bacterium]